MADNSAVLDKLLELSQGPSYDPSALAAERASIDQQRKDLLDTFQPYQPSPVEALSRIAAAALPALLAGKNGGYYAGAGAQALNDAQELDRRRDAFNLTRGKYQYETLGDQLQAIRAMELEGRKAKADLAKEGVKSALDREEYLAKFPYELQKAAAGRSVTAINMPTEKVVGPLADRYIQALEDSGIKLSDPQKEAFRAAPFSTAKDTYEMLLKTGKKGPTDQTKLMLAQGETVSAEVDKLAQMLKDIKGKRSLGNVESFARQSLPGAVVTDIAAPEKQIQEQKNKLAMEMTRLITNSSRPAQAIYNRVLHLLPDASYGPETADALLLNAKQSSKMAQLLRREAMGGPKVSDKDIAEYMASDVSKVLPVDTLKRFAAVPEQANEPSGQDVVKRAFIKSENRWANVRMNENGQWEEVPQ